MADKVLMYRAGVMTGDSDLVLDSLITNSLTVLESSDDMVVSVFGDLVVGQRHPDIIAKFAHGLSSFEVGVAGTGSGTYNTSDGALTLTTTAAINSSYTVTSTDAVRYLPGYAMYTMFTMAFINAGAVGSDRYMAFSNGSDGIRIRETDGALRVQHIRGGVVAIDVLRAAWDDPLNGSGTSGLNIDFSKTNIFQISLGHLGVAPIVLWVHNGVKFVPFHTFYFANLQTATHLVNPYLKIIAKVENTTNNTAINLLTASWNAGSIHGSGIDPASSNRRFNQEVSSAGITSEKPILSIKNKTQYPTGGLTNFVKVVLQSAQGACEGSGSNIIRFRLYKNATLNAGVTTYLNKDVVNSCVEYNTGATGFTGGTQIWLDVAARNSGLKFSLADKKISLYPGDSYTLTAESASSVTVDLSFDWFEAH